MAESTFFVGNYICTEELGRGQYGTVYKGRHKLTHEVVAIKKINVELLSQQQSRMLEFLSREIDVMKKCEHKNIVGLRETIKVAYFTCVCNESLTAFTERAQHLYDSRILRWG